MSDQTYTPEQMLELARACVPEVCSGEVKISFWENGGVIGIYCPFTPIVNGPFDPISNPAHWAAVEKWLFAPKTGLYGFIGKTIGYSQNGIEMVYRIKWHDGSVENFFSQLAAAVAVLERMKGEAK